MKQGKYCAYHPPILIENMTQHFITLVSQDCRKNNTKNRIGKRRILELIFLLFLVSIPFEAIISSMGSLSSWEFLQSAGSLSRFTAFFLISAYFLIGRPLKIRSFPTLWLFIYLLIYFASILVNVYIYQFSISFSVLSVPWLILIFIVCQDIFRDQATRYKGLVVLLYAISFCGLLQLLNFANSRAINIFAGSPDYLRVAAFGDDPNLAGGQYAVGVLIAFIFVLGIIPTHGLVKNTSWIFGVICLFALIQTGSRSAILSLAITILVSFLVKSPKKNRIKLQVVGGLAIILALVLLVINNEGLRTRFDDSLIKGDSSGRYEIYRISYNLLKERPAFGYGPFRNRQIIGNEYGANVTDTHNVFLWVLTANGVLGFSPFLLAIISTLAIAIKVRNGPEGAIPLILFSFTLIFSQSISWHYEKLYWLLLAYVASSGYIKFLR